MSAGSHHRVTPGMPVTEHEQGRLAARRQRRFAIAAGKVTMHLRRGDLSAWLDRSPEWQRGYDAGWRSTL